MLTRLPSARRPFAALLTGLLFAALAASSLAADSPTTGTITPELRANMQRLIQAATNSPLAFQRLETLCDRFGPRFSGTTNLEAALDWILGEMQRDGLEQVRPEPVMVPHWVRGPASLEMITPRAEPLHVLALGGSVATPAEGLTAPLLVVRDFDELTRRAAEARGRIVLFNFTYTGYGSGLPYRSRGATEAARVGAVASLIRSLGPVSLQTPHTGMMRYDEAVPPIPHAAITLEDALMLQRWQDRGEPVTLRLKLAAETLPDAPSRNLLAEWKGRERPDEWVILGGHSDSWDVGRGAMDDGGGCLAAWEAVRLLKSLELRPRRSVRVVLWVNEENGLRGARAYRTNHLAELPRHVLAMESDSGVFNPEGFSFNATGPVRRAAEAALELLQPLGPLALRPGGGGADTSPLIADGVPTMELLVAQEKYFWYHHTAADTVDKLDRNEFNRCVAAMAVMAYVVADWPEPLAR